MKKIVLLAFTIICFVSCTEKPKGVKWVSTTPDLCFVEKPSIQLLKDDTGADVTILTGQALQTIDGFGGCFNELGWTRFPP